VEEALVRNMRLMTANKQKLEDLKGGLEVVLRLAPDRLGDWQLVT
jgi:hypothetical protein